MMYPLSRWHQHLCIIDSIINGMYAITSIDDVAGGAARGPEAGCCYACDGQQFPYTLFPSTQQ
jgi:hypothetical protein